jgi:hypothetical protein
MSEEEGVGGEGGPSTAEIAMYYTSAGLNGLSLIIYIILLLELIICESKWSIIVKFICQLIINSIIHSLTYLIDFVITRTEIQCLIQSILSQYSVIVHVFILTSLFFIALALFKIPDKFEQYRTTITICLIIFCWVVPIIFVVPMNFNFYEEIGDLGSWDNYYCWSESNLSIVLFPIISFVGYTVCIIVTCTLQNTVRIAVSCIDTTEFEDKYDERLRSYALVMWISFVLTILSVIWTILLPFDFYSSDFGSIVNDILTCVCTVGENLTFPLIVMIFWFNNKRWTKLTQLFCCKKEQEKLQESTIVGLANLTVEDMMINDAPDD